MENLIWPLHFVSVPHLIISTLVLFYLIYFFLVLFLMSLPPNILYSTLAFNNSFHSTLPTFINPAPQCKSGSYWTMAVPPPIHKQ